MDYTAHYQSPLGGITLASDGDAIVGIWFDGQKFFAETLEEEHQEKDLPVFQDAFRWLDLYFSGEIPDFTLPLNLRGTYFRRQVWQALLTIPYGQMVTYGDLAKRIAIQRGVAHMSSRAIGGAVGHNPIGIVIPCHRVVGSDDTLTGYAAGLKKKTKLLELEGTSSGVWKKYKTRKKTKRKRPSSI